MGAKRRLCSSGQYSNMDPYVAEGVQLNGSDGWITSQIIRKPFNNGKYNPNGQIIDIKIIPARV